MKTSVLMWIDVDQIKKSIAGLTMEDLIDMQRHIDNLLIGLDSFNFTMDEYDMLNEGARISLIKSIRSRTGFGLAEAKRLAEKWDALILDAHFKSNGIVR